MKDQVGIKGELVIQLIRDGKVVDERKVKNTITTAGVNLVATLVSGSGTAFSHMAIGTGTTSATTSDTTLETEAGRVTLTSKAVTSGTIAYVGDFPAGTGTGSITEAGILNASSLGTMLNRTTFSAVNKTASDALKITWNVTFS
jgi:hypothetical protein